MGNLQLPQAPIAKAEMLIRKPVAEVFEAFVDPEITRRFWSTRVPGVWKRASTPIESADYADKKLATKKHKTLKLKIAWLTRTVTQRRRRAK